MSKQVHIAAAGIIILVFFSCPEKATNPDAPTNPVFSSTSSKCLDRPSIQGLADSVFAYTFADALRMDFRVSANCCPDSDRFVVSNSVGSDTLSIVVIDTAAYGCRCICPYLIHAELGNLPKDHYVVRCRFAYLAAPYLDRDPMYLVDVYRKR